MIRQGSDEGREGWEAEMKGGENGWMENVYLMQAGKFQY